MRRLEATLGVIALACLGYSAWAWVDSRLYPTVESRRLDGILAGRSADHRRSQETPSAARAEAAASGLIGRIEIPRLGLRAVVAEGTDPRTLRRAVGHVTTTPLPGEAGNVALAGHRDSFFSGLKDVRPGDRVRMLTPDGVFEYRVEARRVVGPDRTEVLAPTAAPTLTLITCFPFHYLGSAPRRFIVRARQVASVGEPGAAWAGLSGLGRRSLRSLAAIFPHASACAAPATTGL